MKWLTLYHHIWGLNLQCSKWVWIWNSTIPWLINLTIVCPIQMAVLRNYPIFRFPSGTFDPWSQPKKWTTEMRELRRSTWRNREVPWDVAEPKICHDLPVDNHRTLRAWQKGAIVRGQVGVGTIENKSNFPQGYETSWLGKIYWTNATFEVVEC